MGVIKGGAGWSVAGLDFLRFALALTVTVGHLSQHYFQATWPNLDAFSAYAVGGFFVLSGYTIRAITQRSDGFAVDLFLTDRASRLLSVSVLALLLTIVADVMSYWMAPSFYTSQFGQTTSMPFTRIVLNLLLVSQLYGQDVSPFSNSPFWSLSYEAGFYAIWAAWMYWRRAGGSVLVLGVTLIFFGPNIVALLPFWLLGVLLYDIGRMSVQARRRVVILACLLGLLAGIAFSFYGTLSLDAVKYVKVCLKEAIAMLFGLMQLDSARVTVGIMAGAISFFCVLIPVLFFADRLSVEYAVPKSVSALARRLGELTFPLYLIHFPLLVLARASNLLDFDTNFVKVGLVMVLVFMADACVPMTTKLKDWMRSKMRGPWRLATR